jgi:hypothetical protein
VTFNGGGEANSAAVNITVTNAPPVLGGIGPVAGGLAFNIAGTGQPGAVYVLLGATNLAPPSVWLPVMTNTADGSGNLVFANLPASGSGMFYRIAGN